MFLFKLVLFSTYFGSLSFLPRTIAANTKCNISLGMQNGGILDSKLSSAKAYNNDMFNYGPKHARLKSPQGYRGDKNAPADSWISVGFESKMAVTAIATQGYGNATVQEWVTQYSLMYYVDGKNFQPIKDSTSKQAIFTGNKDSNSINTIKLPFPVTATNIMLLPIQWHNNVGLRIEFYGCPPDFYFTLYVLLAKQPFTARIRNNQSFEYSVAKEEAVNEITSFLNLIPGFLDVLFRGLSPQGSVTTGQMVIAVAFDIYCIESSLQFLLTKLKERVRNSDLFEQDYFKLKYPKSSVCPSPELNLLPLNDEGSKSLTILSSAAPVFKAGFNHNCTHKRQLIVWKTGTIHEGSGRIAPLVPLPSHDLTLKIDTFRSPLVFLQCTVYMTVGNEVSFIYDYKFIRFIDSKLIARIKGPDYTIHGAGNVTLDGGQSSASGDPEFLKDLVLKFKWFCSFKPHEDSQMKGCFGRSISEPISRNKVVPLEIDKLDTGNYNFMLEVSSDDVKVTARHRLTVASYTSLSIKCISNCLAKINPNKKQVLRSTCNGRGCSKIRKYQWIFYLLNVKSKDWTLLPQPINSTSILETGTTFVINNFTQVLGFHSFEDEIFKVKVIGHFNEFVQLNAEAELILNAVPKSENNNSDCSIAPTEGIAMDTYFNISCENWRDNDVPLVFKFQYLIEYGLIILNSGFSPSTTTQLLPGQNVSNYIYNIMIIVNDKYGASQTRYLPVRVKVPSEDQANENIGNVDRELEDLQRKGDTDRSADVSLFVLCLMNVYTQKEETEIKAKDAIIKSMSSLNVTTIEASAKCAAIIKPSTEQPGRMSKETQENALNLIEKVTSVITAEARNSTGGLTLEGAGYFADSLLNGLSNVIGPELEREQSIPVAAGNMKKSPGNNRTKDQLGTITQRTVELVAQVAQILSSLANVGDGPKIITSKNVDVRVEKDVPASFDGKVIKDSQSIIELPPLKDVLSNVNGSVNVMGCQLIEYKNNPFNWHPSSRSVRSGIIDISLDNDGYKIEVNSLKHPISLYLSKNTAGQKSGKHEEDFFLTPVESLKELNTTNSMNFHSIYIPSEYVTVSIHLVPEEGNIFEMFIRPKEKPTPLNYSYFRNIPDLSLCSNQSIRNLNISLCTSDPYKIDINSNITGFTGLHYIGIRALPKLSKKVRFKRVTQNIKHGDRYSAKEKVPNSTSDKDGARVSNQRHGRQKRSCIGVKDQITSPPKLARPIYNSETDVKYTFNTYLSACLFWSEEKEAWDSKGCKLGSNSNSSHVHCLCDHMTAFGGDIFVAPNPINFDYVLQEFGNIGETGNFVVLTTVLVMWSAYFVGLVFARRADLQDKRKIINCTINDFDEIKEPKKTYRISIQTGVWLGAGTTASVALILHGVEDSLPIYLNNTDPNKQLFARGSVNTYWITLSENIGDIFKIKIWHNNAGTDPSWFLYDIVIDEEDSESSWYFLVNKWLAVDKGGVIADTIVTEEKEQKKLKNRFLSRAAKQFSNAHLWLSIFTKSVHSPFTRCQRLTCCFLVLTSTMITNAMFYRFGSEPTETFLIGPFKASLTSIKTGIQSSLIVLPINVFVALIFEKVKSKRTIIDGRVVLHEEDSQGFIPRSLIPVAWFLCVSGCLVSSIFTIFYSLMWGSTIANQWLLSTVISFTQDVIVNQPIKIAVLVSLLAMIIKKPIDSRQGVTLSVKRDNVDGHAIEIPLENSLSKARAQLAAILTAKNFLMEIVFYGVFVMLVFVVCYGNINKERFHQTTSIKLIADNFHEVQSSVSFWKWLEDDGIPFLYDTTWYNDRPFSGPEGYTSSKKTFLIGMPRLRQLRVKSDTSCLDIVKDKLVKHSFKTCLQHYDIRTEDRTPYSLPGWKPLPTNNTTNSPNFIKNSCPKPWRYSGFKSIQTLPYMSSDILYGGGGYVADLGYNKSTAMYVCDNLKSNGWIDDHTAAVFWEFTVFSPSTMLFSSVKLLLERFSYGTTNTIERIDTFKVYSTTNKTFLEVCQFFLMILILVAIGMEFKRLIIERADYFKNIWNILQWFQIGTVVSAIVISYLKESYTSTFLKRIEANPFETSSSDYIVLWSDLETFLLGLVIFILTIKLLRIIRFNRFIVDLSTGLKSAKTMAGPLIVLFIIVMTALSSMANILFGDSSYDFSTFTRSLSKLVTLLAGGKLFQKKTHFADSPFGLVFGILYTTTTSLILVNVFVSVLIDSMKDLHDNTNEDSLSHPMREIRRGTKNLLRKCKFKTRPSKKKIKHPAEKYELLHIDGDTKCCIKNGKMQTVIVYDMLKGNSFTEIT